MPAVFFPLLNDAGVPRLLGLRTGAARLQRLLLVPCLPGALGVAADGRYRRHGEQLAAVTAYWRQGAGP